MKLYLCHTGIGCVERMHFRLHVVVTDWLSSVCRICLLII